MKKKLLKRRKKGEGRIFKKKLTNGKLSKYFYLRYTINGVSNEVSLNPATTRIDAEKEAKKYLPDIQAKTKIEISYNVAKARNLNLEERVAIDKAFELFQKSSKRQICSEQTLKTKKYAWEYLLRRLPKNIIYINEITEHHIDSFFADLQKEKAPRTYNEFLKNLKHVFNILLQDSRQNPCNNIRRIAEETVNKKFFTEDQFKNVFLAFGDYKQLPLTEKEKKIYKEKPKLKLLYYDEVKILFNIGAWTGQRLKDCVLLEWDRVDWQFNIIKVRPAKTKTNKQKFIPIPIHSNLYDALKEAEKWKCNDYVLPQLAKRYNKVSSRPCTNHDCIKVLKYSGLETTVETGAMNRSNVYGFHSFRHTFATYLFNAGVSINIIEILTGASIDILMNHYVHLRTGTLQSAISKLPVLNDNGDIVEVRDILADRKRLIIEKIENINDVKILEKLDNILEELCEK